MRSAAFMIIVLSLSLAATTAVRAQTVTTPTEPPRLNSPFVDANDPAPAKQESGPSNTTAVPESVPTPQAHTKVTAVPPLDPPQTNWGSYSEPQPIPFSPPPVGYDLVGPPRGVFQRNFGQLFSGFINNPGGVPALDAGLTFGINIARPDGLAPIGVRGDHTLRAGHAMFSIRYTQQTFDGNLNTHTPVTTASVLADFPFAPRHMLQNQETAILEYGVTDDLTMQFLLPFENSRIDYLTRAGNTYTTTFGNPGDIKVAALYTLFREPGRQLHLNFGINFPTGFLDYQNFQPDPALPNLPYVIRTSTGTYDLLPGLTYRAQNDQWTWGAQSIVDVHLGSNRAEYRVGDQIDVTAWLSRRWTANWATSVRIDGQGWGNVHNVDPRLDRTLSPTYRRDMQGGARLNMLLGINYWIPQCRVPGQMFSVEGGAPVVQSVEGSQLGLDWVLNAGWTILW